MEKAPEPEFLKIWKYNLAESVSAGFQFNCFDIFNDKTLDYRLLDHLSGLLKCIQKNLLYQQTTTIACPNPVVLSDLWKGGSSRKVDFSASSKCLRIRAPVSSCLWRGQYSPLFLPSQEVGGGAADMLGLLLPDSGKICQKAKICIAEEKNYLQQEIGVELQWKLWKSSV